MANRIGTTIRSWNSSTDSATRPTGVAGAVLLDQKLHHDRGRGQREAHAEHDDAGGRRDAAHADGGADRDDADRDLHQADAEHVAPQLPQPRQRQFQAEQEQQEHDAEFGERLGRLRVVQRDVAQDRIIIVEIAERRTARAPRPISRKPSTVPRNAMQQRHEDAGGDQEDQDALQVFGVKHRLRFPYGDRSTVTPLRPRKRTRAPRLTGSRAMRGTTQAHAAPSAASIAFSAASALEPSGPPACAMSGLPPPPLPPSTSDALRTRSTAEKRDGQIGRDADHDAALAVLAGRDQRDHARADLLLALVGEALEVLDVDAGRPRAPAA